MKKIPLILLHGWLGAPGDWRPFREALGGAFSCHAVALPGHAGAPPLPAGAGPGDAIRWLENAWPVRNKPAVLLGYSMGGRLALNFACRRPRLVSLVIAVSASPGVGDPAERRARRRLDAARAARLESGAIRDFLSDWYDQPLFASLQKKPALRRRLIEIRSRNPGPGAAALLRAFGAGRVPSLWARLGRLRVPSCWVAGEDDGTYAVLAARAARLSPGGRAFMVPGSGHMPHIEQPARLAAIVRRAAGRIP